MIDIDQRYRKIAKVGHSNAPYYSFTIKIIKGQGNLGQKTWLLHHGQIETWDMVEYD